MVEQKFDLVVVLLLIQLVVIFVLFLIVEVMVQLMVWMNCVLRFLEIEKNLYFFDEYMIGNWCLFKGFVELEQI